MGLLTILLWIVYRSQAPPFEMGFGRAIDYTLLFIVIFSFVLIADDPGEYSSIQWFVLACFGIFLAVFVYHTYTVRPGSVRSLHAIWGGTLLGLWLVVLPRYIPVEMFIWTFTRVAAGMTLIAMTAYAIGPYELYGMSVGFHDIYSIPGADAGFRALRGLFVNRNTFAIVAFGGFLCAMIETHRRHKREHSLPRQLSSATLLLILTLGYFLSFGRVAWVVGVVPLFIYFAYMDFGRRSLPLSTTLSVFYIFGGIIFVYYIWINGIMEDTHRFPNWLGSLRAIYANPTWFGEGIINTRDFIEPYQSGNLSPHNSYLSTWIRFGIVGGMAYILIIIAALFRGMQHFRVVDVGVLILAFAFSFHQLFESYTMFRWVFGSTISAISMGFLVFGRWGE